jgi:hypothetical protein
VQRLVKAGERLADAQAEAIRAQSGDAFLDARRDQRQALEALAAGAREILVDAGRSAAAVDRVLATLRAGSLTADGRALLKSGRLTEELEPPGFEALAGLEIPVEPSRPRLAKKTAPRSREPKAKAVAPTAAQPEEPSRAETQRRRELANEARRRIRDRQRELVALEKRTATAERRAAQLRDQLKDAEADASRLDGERRQVEEELAAAERELEQLRDEE